MMSRQNQWILLDKFRRKQSVKVELKRHLLRSVVKSNYTPLALRYNAQFLISNLPQFTSSVKRRNRCVYSGRVWMVVRKAQMGRFVFRFRSYKSDLPGVRRSNW